MVASKPDGAAWRPSPDVMIYAQGGRAPRAEMSVATAGLPALVIEILSTSTWTYDVDDQGGKAWGYLRLGVPFYLVFDPYATLLGQSCRGWRQDGGAIRAWLPEPDGRYHVPSLSISFQPEQDLLRVYDPDGKRVPFYFEKDQSVRVVAEERDLLARQREEDQRRITTLEAEMARLRAQLAGQEDTRLSG
jgi:uncharacterized small protein (DUF1192 family)